MKKQPLVSVVIPFLNHGKYVVEAVASVLAQTYQQIEICIVDDGSTETGAQALLRKIAKQDKRISIIFLPESQGPSVARNIGIQKAKGKYILPLDADDKIDPTCVQKAVTYIENHPECSVVYSEVCFFGERDGPFPLDAYSFPEILYENCVVSCALYRRSDWEKYGGYNENMKEGLEDWDFWLYFVEDGKKFHQLPEMLFFYRQKSHGRNDIRRVRKQRKHLFRKIRKNHPKLYRYYAFNKLRRKFVKLGRKLQDRIRKG